MKVDEKEVSPGNKFYFWEMKGVPLRLEIGENELKAKEYTLYLRDEHKKIKIKSLNDFKKNKANHLIKDLKTKQIYLLMKQSSPVKQEKRLKTH